MVKKYSLGGKAFDGMNFLLMVFLCLIFVYPLYHVLMASLSNADKLFVHEGLLLYPKGLSVMSYKLLFKDPQIVQSLINSILYVVFGTILSLLMTSFAAYALTRKKFALKKAFLVYIIITMYFGGGLIPFYLVVSRLLNLGDTPLAIILPSALNTFYVFIMMSFFKTIPESLEESAYIDGANDFTILFKVMLPVAMPVVAVLTIYYAVGQWNSWFNAMLFLNKKRFDYQPLQLVLREILIQNTTFNMTSGAKDAIEVQKYKGLIKYSLIIVTIAPIIIIYPFMQKHFVKGVMIGSIKG